MSGAATKRIIREISDLKKFKSDQIKEINQPDESDIFTIVITLENLNTPYEDGVFKLHINFPADYPFKHPKCVMNTKIFHPNIDHNGKICLKDLIDNWSIYSTLTTVVTTIISVINNPDPDDSLSPEIAKLYKEDRNSFIITAKTWTSLYAQ
ncbi:ubiquitin-conjugating enzyme family protein [bacterium]|nr:ubiquitin-conjugating enzyme family protein [bacterium]